MEEARSESTLTTPAKIERGAADAVGRALRAETSTDQRSHPPECSNLLPADAPQFFFKHAASPRGLARGLVGEVPEDRLRARPVDVVVVAREDGAERVEGAVVAVDEAQAPVRVAGVAVEERRAVAWAGKE